MFHQKDCAGNFIVRDGLLNDRVESRLIRCASGLPRRFLREGWRRPDNNQAQHSE
jgi:hypothetical protein